MASVTGATPRVESVPVFRSAAFWGLLGFLSVMAVFAVLAALSWPGEADSCTLPGGNCYCETIVADAPVKQVVNTWTGLFAVAAGLVILGIADRDRSSAHAGAGPMASGGLYAVMYGALAVFLGPGSMFFHGGMTRFGGWLDNLSMVLYVSFLLLYDAARIFRFDANRTIFLVLYSGVILFLGSLIWAVDGSGKYVFGILAVSAMILQAVIILAKPNGLSRTFIPWLLSALIAFGVAFPIWILSWTGMPLCAPSSPLQGHGLWHILAMAATPFFIFFYLRGETRTEPAAR